MDPSQGGPGQAAHECHERLSFQSTTQQAYQWPNYRARTVFPTAIHPNLHPHSTHMEAHRAWPPDMMAHVPPGYAEQQAQAAFMQQFTTMIASAAAAGAMAAIQTCCPGAATPIQAQAAFCAAANGAASMAASRATELLPSAFPRPMTSAEHFARTRGLPIGAESNNPFASANHSEPAANSGLAGPPAAATTAPPSTAQQSFYPASVQPQGFPRRQPDPSNPQQAVKGRDAMASYKPPEGDRQGPGEPPATANHEAAWPRAHFSKRSGDGAALLTSEESELIKKVRVYACIVRPGLVDVIHGFRTL
jgi:hypothetical protein